MLPESNIELESVINDAKAALSQQYITLKEARDAFDENAAKQQSLAQVGFITPNEKMSCIVKR